MTTLKELIAQREDLDKQIAELRQIQRGEAISQALTLISEYQLTQLDLFGDTGGGKKVKVASKVAAKYRNIESGKEWTGRGVTPKWITESGKDKSHFLIT